MRKKKKKNFKCLMLKTRDNRKYFTHEKNYDYLIEFSRTFGAEVSVVEVEEAEVLDLEELAPAICDCDPVYKTTPEFKRFIIRDLKHIPDMRSPANKCGHSAECSPLNSMKR